MEIGCGIREVSKSTFIKWKQLGCFHGIVLLDKVVARCFFHFRVIHQYVHYSGWKVLPLEVLG